MGEDRKTDGSWCKDVVLREVPTQRFTASADVPDQVVIGDHEAMP